MDRLGARIIHEPFGDCDGAAGFERAKSFFEQLATVFFAFTVQNVAERDNVVAVAKICRKQIALDKIESVTRAEFLGDPLGRWNHSRPVKRGHADVRRFLTERDPPDAGAGAEIEYAHFAPGLGKPQMVAKFLRGGVTHRDDVLDELAEKFCSFGF